jgi:hypothetical protein
VSHLVALRIVPFGAAAFTAVGADAEDEDDPLDGTVPLEGILFVPERGTAGAFGNWAPVVGRSAVGGSGKYVDEDPLVGVPHVIPLTWLIT